MLHFIIVYRELSRPGRDPGDAAEPPGAGLAAGAIVQCSIV